MSGTIATFSIAIEDGHVVVAYAPSHHSPVREIDPSPAQVTELTEALRHIVEGARSGTPSHLGSFSQALVALKAGARVRRAGWNGKGMWIALTPGSVIEQRDARAGAAAIYANDLARQEEAVEFGVRTITIGAHIDMKAADGSVVVGWLASQTDMLAEDWEVVP